MDTNMVQSGLLSGGVTPASTAVPNAVLPGAGKIDIPTPKGSNGNTTTPQVSEQEQVAYDPDASEATRLENMQIATEAMFKDIYAVGDTRFAIYKDTSGQFVTRFTSLRDGKVSYIPEPDMMAYLERRGQQRKALLKIDV